MRDLGVVARREIYVAGRGEHGGGSRLHGRRGTDLGLRVPIGTIVLWKTEGEGWEIREDLVIAGQRGCIARGGRGGLGNARFASATRQAPRVAEHGTPGEEHVVRLFFKVLCDVAIVGLPNVGKSSLLAALTGARPKVAAYPYTTQEPQVGVMTSGFSSFTLVDLPPLGDSGRAGPGLAFLQHAERAKVLLHVLDAASADPEADMAAVNAELTRYGQGLAEKEQAVVINKLDLPEAQERQAEIRERLLEKGIEALAVSAVTGEGVADLKARLAAILERYQRAASQ